MSSRFPFPLFSSPNLPYPLSLRIHTITPWNSESSESDAESDDSEQPTSKPPRRYILQTQSRLSTSKSKPRLKPGVARATLVVAPMTLLSQWCDELERSSKEKGGLRVLMYYGAGRSSGKGLQEEIDAGVDVVVTRYVLSPFLLPFGNGSS